MAEINRLGPARLAVAPQPRGRDAGLTAEALPAGEESELQTPVAELHPGIVALLTNPTTPPRLGELIERWVRLFGDP